MKIIAPYVEILDLDPIRDLERMYKAGKTCYRTEKAGASVEEQSKFISNIVKRGHLSVIEHSSVTVRFVCDRGISHEIVRHRLAAFSQESTRYCNYSQDRFENSITVIKPQNIEEDSQAYYIWFLACENAERAYFKLLDAGVKPEDARAVLPTCLKTELVVTANLREWKHIIDIRTDSAAHPDIRSLMSALNDYLSAAFPEIFEDSTDGNALPKRSDNKSDDLYNGIDTIFKVERMYN